MVQSKATTVEQYLAELPEERRTVVGSVRDLILQHLPDGYQEVMNWGMISYEVPLARYPQTYNKQPLSYAALAAQKNHYALYLTCVYQSPAQEAELREIFERAGKTLDMGKSCIRFRRLEDLPLDALGSLVSGTTVDQFIAQYEASRKRSSRP